MVRRPRNRTLSVGKRTLIATEGAHRFAIFGVAATLVGAFIAIVIFEIQSERTAPNIQATWCFSHLYHTRNGLISTCVRRSVGTEEAVRFSYANTASPWARWERSAPRDATSGALGAHYLSEDRQQQDAPGCLVERGGILAKPSGVWTKCRIHHGSLAAMIYSMPPWEC